MAFLTEEFLRRKAEERVFEKFAYEAYIKESKKEAEVTVFLSHSHKDKKLVEGFIRILAEQGILIYVDWNDECMPRITNKDTALKIKGKIKELDLFMLLATENALKSRWCPWELGVADSVKNWEEILIIPVADPSGRFEGNEYLQIYRHLEIIGDKIIILDRPIQIIMEEERVYIEGSYETLKKYLKQFRRF